MSDPRSPATPSESVFFGIAVAARREILQYLLDCHDDGKAAVTITEVSAGLHISRFSASRHLALLRDAALVVETRSGQHRLQVLQLSRLEEVEEWLLPFLQAQDRGAELR